MRQGLRIGKLVRRGNTQKCSTSYSVSPIKSGTWEESKKFEIRKGANLGVWISKTDYRIREVTGLGVEIDVEAARQYLPENDKDFLD